MSRIAWKSAALVLVILFSVAAGMSYLKKDAVTWEGRGPRAPLVEAEIMPVRAVEVYSTGGTPTRWYAGVSHADLKEELSFRIGGTVKEIRVKKGDRLRFERVIARLDTKEYEGRVKKLETALERAKVEALLAEANLKRVRALHKNGAATGDELDAARSAFKSAERDVRNRRKLFQVERRKLGYHELRFTKRGVVSSVNVKAGEEVKAGQTVAVFDLDMPLEITVELPAVLIAQVGVGSKGKAEFDGIKRIFPVSVSDIGEVRSAPGATFPVTVRLRRPYPNLRAGLKARVSFRFDYRARRKHFILPATALGKDEVGFYVCVVKPSGGDYGIIERRYVTAGRLSAQGREVLSGLADGEMVVTQGIYRLEAGMKVKWK